MGENIANGRGAPAPQIPLPKLERRKQSVSTATGANAISQKVIIF